MTKVLWIAAGGAVGASMRYLIAGWCQRLAAGGFPIGTLAVNVAGCFTIGLLTAAFSGGYWLREEYRLAILVGVLGGLTTFSTFGWETFAMVNDQEIRSATANVLLNNMFGFGAVWIGYRIGERFL